MYEIRSLGQLPPTRQQLLEQAVTDALIAVGLESHPAGRWNVTPASFEQLVEGVLRIGNSRATAYEYEYFKRLEVWAELRQRGYVTGEETPPIPQPNGGPGAEDILPPLQQPPPAFPLWLILLGLGVFAFAGRDNKRRRKSQGQAASTGVMHNAPTAIPEEYLLLSGEGCRDAEGQFIPVPQCTGRLPKKKAKKPAKVPELKIVNPDEDLGKKTGYREFFLITSEKGESGYHRILGKPVTIPGFEEGRFFLHRSIDPVKGYPWKITEATTGFGISPHGAPTHKAAVERVKERLEVVTTEAFRKTIASTPKIWDRLPKAQVPEHLRLSGLSGDGCRDAEGNFIPTWQCTGRPRPKDIWKFLEKTPRQIIYKAKGHEGLVIGDTKKFTPRDQKHISEIFNDTREVLKKYRRIRNYYGFTKETLKRDNLLNPHTNIIHDLVRFDRYFGMGSSGIDRRGIKVWWYSPKLSRQATEKLKQMVEATPPAAIAHEVTHTIGSTRELIDPLGKAIGLRFYLRHPNYVSRNWLDFEVETVLRQGLGKAKPYNIEAVKAVYEANPKYVDNILEKWLAPKDQERLRQAIK